MGISDAGELSDPTRSTASRAQGLRHIEVECWNNKRRKESPVFFEPPIFFDLNKFPGPVLLELQVINVGVHSTSPDGAGATRRSPSGSLRGSPTESKDTFGPSTTQTWTSLRRIYSARGIARGLLCKRSYVFLDDSSGSTWSDPLDQCKPQRSLSGPPYRENALYLMRCGSVASAPRRFLSSSSPRNSPRTIRRGCRLRRRGCGWRGGRGTAVVADHDGAAGEIFERLFERGERLRVEVVGRLVEEEHVRARLQHLGRMHAVRSPPESLPTGFC